jgi:hypothetical protein
MEVKNLTVFTDSLVCEKCHVKCSRQAEWNRHILTRKHQKRHSGNILEENFTTEKIYECECKKIYKTHSGLWKHKKVCTEYINLEPSPTEVSFLTNLVLEIVKNNNDLQKQNHELQQKVLDVCKHTSSNYISHNNSHNKTFNLQFFLNEQCKDAMNLMEFVDSMTLELSDLEEVGTLGYVEGISNIIIRKLNALDIYKRPIHCSDGKREIVFVKEDNVWEKENNTYDKLRKVIKRVTYKNSAMLVPWSEKYPNCMNNQHHLNDVYVRMMGQAMGGREAFVDSENKIMKKIAKAVLINKLG